MEADGLMKAEKKRWPVWLRGILWLAFGGGLVLIAAVAALVGFYLGSPVAPPPTVPVDARRSGSALSRAGESSNPTSKFTSDVSLSALVSTATAHGESFAMAGKPTGVRDEKAVNELMAEAAQPSAELKAKARAINESFARLGVEFEDYMVKKGKRTDPDEMTSEETRALRAVHERVASIRRELRSGFGPAEVEQFDGVYLGMLAERKDWYDAAIFCADIRGNWKEARYCCRQMESWEGGVFYFVMKFCKLATGSADFYFAE